MVSSSYQICDLFKNPGSQLAKIISQAKALSALNQVFMEVLPPELAEHCRVGQFERGVLTLFTDNAADATRIRYSTADLLTKLRTAPQWAGLIKIQVKIESYQPKPVTVIKEDQPKMEITENVREQLECLIEKMAEQKGCERLVESLRKLSNKR